MPEKGEAFQVPVGPKRNQRPADLHPIMILSEIKINDFDGSREMFSGGVSRKIVIMEAA